MGKYRAAFSMGVLGSLEYRFDFLIGLLGVVYPIAIQGFLWLAVYGGTSARDLYGYSYARMMAYVVAAAFVGRLVNTGVENAINEDIHSGGLSRYLVKPVAYILFRMAHTLGSRMISMGVLLALAVAGAGALHVGGGLRLEAMRIVLFIPALTLGVLLNFFIFFLISMLAFWLTEVGAFFMTIQVIILVISGGVFPISVLGERFVQIMRWLPFIYTIYFPLDVLTGQGTWEYMAVGIGLQAFWIALLAGLSIVVWKRGIRHYVAVGG